MGRAVAHAYDRIGADYARQRRPDPRMSAPILAALRGADSVVNVGAGAGAYEPRDAAVVAVEPALTMVRQRPPGAAPVVRGCAEALPFGARAFGAAMAVLTLHHWRDWRAGVREMIRVARGAVAIFTWDPDSAGFWFADYAPELLAVDRRRFPSIAALTAELVAPRVTAVPIPHDCSDGFMGAYWRRPEAYLSPEVRGAISSLAEPAAQPALERLRADLASGAWTKRHVHLLDLDELDLGYRLVVGRAI
jgi:SAM-dependent methyltransferase